MVHILCFCKSKNFCKIGERLPRTPSGRHDSFGFLMGFRNFSRIYYPRIRRRASFVNRRSSFVNFRFFYPVHLSYHLQYYVWHFKSVKAPTRSFLFFISHRQSTFFDDIYTIIFYSTEIHLHHRTRIF